MGKLRAVGYDIFAGGFTAGVRHHFDVVAHLEHATNQRGDSYGQATARRNLPEVAIRPGPPWPQLRDVVFVYGNPPCAPWSQAAGQDRSRWGEDPRLAYVRDGFSLLTSYRPRVWAWESVTGAFTRGRELVDSLVEQAAEADYACTYLLLDAARVGAAQHRKRFFLLLHDVELDLQPVRRPAPTVAQVLARVPRAPDQEAWLAQQLARLESLRTLQRAWQVAQPGMTLRQAAKVAWGHTHRVSFLAKRLALHDVADTIMGDFTKLWHPTEPRPCTSLELMALAGFPRSWRFEGNLNTHADQLSRGVLPPVGRWLARAVRRGIEAGHRPGARRRLVDLRGPTPVYQVLT